MASTRPARTHQRLTFEREPPRLAAHANLSRYGAPGGAAPLVLYVGGAIGRTEYQARSETEPLPVVAWADGFGDGHGHGAPPWARLRGVASAGTTCAPLPPLATPRVSRATLP